jgi:hypothetical protein
MKVDADGRLPKPDLARSGLSDLDVLEPKNVRAAGFTQNDGFAHCAFLQ